MDANTVSVLTAGMALQVVEMAAWKTANGRRRSAPGSGTGGGMRMAIMAGWRSSR